MTEETAGLHKHAHKCMRCDAEFYCLYPEVCKASKNVMPRVIVPGPNGPEVFEHVCKQKDKS